MSGGNCEWVAPKAFPALEVLNRQRGKPLDLAWLRAGAREALAACLRVSAGHGAVLSGLEEVCVTLVSDRKIAEIHRDFMGITGATDVITFQHGEVVVSVETAEREARERGICFHGELLLYVVHGFLHLSGYDDVDPEARALMHREQERIWSDVLAVQTRLSVEKNGSRSGGERRASSRCGVVSAGE